MDWLTLSLGALLKAYGIPGALWAAIIFLFVKVIIMERALSIVENIAVSKSHCDLQHRQLTSDMKEVKENIGKLFDKVDQMPERIINLLELRNK